MHIPCFSVSHGPLKQSSVCSICQAKNVIFYEHQLLHLIFVIDTLRRVVMFVIVHATCCCHWAIASHLPTCLVSDVDCASPLQVEMLKALKMASHSQVPGQVVMRSKRCTQSNKPRCACCSHDSVSTLTKGSTICVAVRSPRLAL